MANFFGQEATKKKALNLFWCCQKRLIDFPDFHDTLYKIQQAWDTFLKLFESASLLRKSVKFAIFIISINNFYNKLQPLDQREVYINS